MDSFYPKTRRPIAHRHNPLKRSKTPTTPQITRTPIPATTQTSKPAPPQPILQPQPRPTTPERSKIVRPSQPPPIKRKQVPNEIRQARQSRLTVRELFQSVHPPRRDGDGPNVQTLKHDDKPDVHPLKCDNNKLTVHPLRREDEEGTNNNTKEPEPISPSKISKGPLKGVSTSLLDLVRAKEARVKETPEQLRERELLGIASDVTRIVHNVFTANKRQVLPYQIVVEKCHKGLKSNYSTSTIEDCLILLQKITPEWVTDVEISRGRYMRINRDKYDWPQLSKAIELYKKPTR